MGHVRFSRMSDDGSEVSLRVLDVDQQLAVVADEPAPPAAPQEPRDDVTEDGPLDDVWESVLQIRPNLVAVADDETNPVWWVQPRRGPGHLATLAYAAGLLGGDDRVAAVAAHVDMLTELVAHERAARALDDDELESYEPFCVACWAEPESHAMVLADAVLERTRELVDALSQFGFRLGPSS